MMLARSEKRNPMQLAEQLAAALRQVELVTGDYRGYGFTVTVAKPGFLNIHLESAVWHAQLREILAAGPRLVTRHRRRRAGQCRISSRRTSTGPMHVGRHSRQVVVGDALASLFRWGVSFAVQREYYINDAGAQVDILARSTHLRYHREAIGEASGEFQKRFYPGEYLIETGQALAKRDGRKWLDLPEDAWLSPVRDFAVAQMMALIREDLAGLGVRHDLFMSEALRWSKSGTIDDCLMALDQRGLIYTGVLEPPKGKLPDDWEPRDQTLFRATQFGDDVDRPLRKSDGSWTYFAADIAYHRDKFRRGFANLIDVWGADHGGYVKRMQAAVKAVTEGTANLDVKLCQLVNLFDEGSPVRMSKRAGTFVTLREVVDQVGKDVYFRASC